MNFKQRAKSAAKQLRASQPFNYAATSGVRALLRATGRQPEAVVKHLHRTGITRARLPNNNRLRLWSRGDDWVSNQIFWRGWDGYEPEAVPLFYRLATRSQTTFDVGSYVGYFTLLAAHANRKSRVYAFEPMPASFKRLQKNVALNGLSHRVRCIQAAVGAEDGTAEFFHVDADMPTSSSLSREFMEGADRLKSSVVPVIALDRFVRDNNIQRLDLMKIDTETTEPDVLRGLSETLQRDHPAMICEVLHGRGSGKPLQEILEPLGYRFYLLTPDGPQLQSEIQGHAEWFNYLFTTQTPAEVERL